MVSVVVVRVVRVTGPRRHWRRGGQASGDRLSRFVLADQLDERMVNVRSLVPSTAVMTSFSLRPALSAGPPGSTAPPVPPLLIHAPSVTVRPLRVAMPASSGW